MSSIATHLFIGQASESFSQGPSSVVFARLAPFLAPLLLVQALMEGLGADGTGADGGGAGADAGGGQALMAWVPARARLAQAHAPQ